MMTEWLVVPRTALLSTVTDLQSCAHLELPGILMLELEQMATLLGVQTPHAEPVRDENPSVLLVQKAFLKVLVAANPAELARRWRRSSTHLTHSEEELKKTVEAMQAIARLASGAHVVVELAES